MWLDGIRVAELRPRKPWDLRCQYSAEALDRWSGLAPLLSCSLPLQRRALDASVFARGLLPEGRHLQALSAELGVAVNDTHALLRRFGRDVAGALVIATEQPVGREQGVAPYTTRSLEQEVFELSDRPLAIHDDSELSVAGLQDKLLLVALAEGGWGRPIHGFPSTHILKVDDPLRPGLVRAEAECLGLARELGLTTVDAQVLHIAERACLLVSRFDRVTTPDGHVARVHQEDACQALARNPEAARGRGKYEDAGGPALRELAALLDRYAADPSRELDRLLQVATFTVLIGNADAHGKNLALLHPTAETISLAPLYDTVPTVLWPKLRTRAAMSIGGRWELTAVTVEDLVVEAASWRLDRGTARATVLATAERLRSSVTLLDPESPVARLVTERASALLRSR